MFEDSTFESTGRIRTRSRGWMIAATLFNSSILLTLILIPLIYPDALPNHTLPILISVPTPPPTQDPPPPQRSTPARGVSEMTAGGIQAPIHFPRTPFIPDSPEPAGPIDPSALGPGPGVPGGVGLPAPGHPAASVVRLVPKAPVRLSGGVMEGLLIDKKLPVYPRLAIAVRAEGTVVLQATISKAGTIENLHVVSGPPMLQQAAIDAVQSWRYKPYLLGGEPVEVETTVNVIFTLGR
ncbi:MAG: energy transducer TonB [Terracidiphilus sp.]|jgi:periplasmic protein TonB